MSSLAANRSDDSDEHVAFLDLLIFDEWDMNRTSIFMKKTWVPLSLKITAYYLLFVYVGRKLMNILPAFDNPVIYKILVIWNFGISFFSGIAVAHLLPELIRTLNEHGFVASYCQPLTLYTNPQTGYWSWLFVMSKLVELGDTVFLIVMKKPMLFLHWYHHAYTLWFATPTYAKMQAWCRWSFVLNLSVHAIMYFYFGLRALRIRMPRYISMFVTSIQILQFIQMCYIFYSVIVIKIKEPGVVCFADWEALLFGGVMYYSFICLFSKLFYDSYIRRPVATSHQSEKIE